MLPELPQAPVDAPVLPGLPPAAGVLCRRRGACGARPSGAALPARAADAAPRRVYTSPPAWAGSGRGMRSGCRGRDQPGELGARPSVAQGARLLAMKHAARTLRQLRPRPLLCIIVQALPLMREHACIPHGCTQSHFVRWRDICMCHNMLLHACNLCTGCTQFLNPLEPPSPHLVSPG